MVHIKLLFLGNLLKLIEQSIFVFVKSNGKNDLVLKFKFNGQNNMHIWYCVLKFGWLMCTLKFGQLVVGWCSLFRFGNFIEI